ncbi:uncharacterized protein At5g39865 [Ziziphus jujuba]|uniref:Uncharacterized protein At5g39865 n=2 Tax=Ziziphus jujuba TaxID=326968 RepID=A0A6P4ATR2_ZIZJJ|nr:uncharacterized protein At5g39865 [Ziziphus jujuba]KAH7512265.1 hypothetical protein FEM48_Zijuj12G0072200 [Ziziphus jujuba var. spinosa]
MMKGVKGKFLKKFKAIQTIGTLKQGLVFHQLNPTSEKLSNIRNTQPPPLLHREQELKNDHNLLSDQLLGSNGLSKRFKDLNHEDMESEFNVCEKVKENVSPTIDTSGSPIFSEITMEEEHHAHQEAKGDDFNDDVDDEIYPSLSDFQEKCPPGGNNAIILYTTSLRGIRKTFEDCHAIRFLLESFRIVFYERDVSMHLDFREELWKILGGRVIPPRLFVKGRYIGGADEVVGLHEQGKLKKLLEGIPIELSNSTCTGCANMRFLVCFNCNGSRKVLKDIGENNDDDLYIRCPDCNENGLVKCPICS